MIVGQWMRVAAVVLVLSAWGLGATTRPAVRATSRPVVQRKESPPAIKASPRSRRSSRNVATTRNAALQPITPAATERAVAHRERWVERVSKATDLEFAELETQHFMVYHNWDEREERFLSENVEGCYAAISRQFDVSPSETVFAGKPPLFMISGEEAYARVVDEVVPSMDPKMYVGVAMIANDGNMCMIMKRPTKSDREDLSRTQKRWASTLAHEMTYLFAARYHTDRSLPAWLSVGMAEVMEVQLFPELDPREMMSRQIGESDSAARLMELKQPRNPEEYACMRTMVETLLAANRQSFIELIARVKDGVSGEEALQECFGWSLEDMQDNWRDYLREEYNVRWK